jgi:hypothetical protein
MAFATNLTGVLVENTYGENGEPLGIKNNNGALLAGGTDSSLMSYTSLGLHQPQTSIVSGVGGVDAAIKGEATFNDKSRDGLQIVLGAQTGIAGLASSALRSPSSNSAEVARTPLDAIQVLSYSYKSGIRAGNWNISQGFTTQPVNVPLGVRDIEAGRRLTSPGLTGVDLAERALNITSPESKWGQPDGWISSSYSGQPNVLATGSGMSGPGYPGGPGGIIIGPSGEYISVTGYSSYFADIETFQSTPLSGNPSIVDLRTQRFRQMAGTTNTSARALARQNQQQGTEKVNIPIQFMIGGNPPPRVEEVFTLPPRLPEGTPNMVTTKWIGVINSTWKSNTVPYGPSLIRTHQYCHPIDYYTTFFANNIPATPTDIADQVHKYIHAWSGAVSKAPSGYIWKTCLITHPVVRPVWPLDSSYFSDSYDECSSSIDRFVTDHQHTPDQYAVCFSGNPVSVWSGYM